MTTKLYYTYVLENQNGFYVGITKDILGRYEAHLDGRCKSSSLFGESSKLKLIHVWTSGKYSLASKLERFIHKSQREVGNYVVLDIIDTMPDYTQILQTMINELMPTTAYELKIDAKDNQ